MPFSAASSSFPGGGGALKQKQIGKNETSYLGTYYPTRQLMLKKNTDTSFQRAETV